MSANFVFTGLPLEGCSKYFIIKEIRTTLMTNLATPLIQIPTSAANRARGILFSEPRELSGKVLSAIEETLKLHEGDRSSQLVENWYKGANIADYNTNEAAAAYLGAYGSRSILKYQEAAFSLLRLKSQLAHETTILDYGSGPCVGFAALVDLWTLLSEILGELLTLNYVALDRSPNMLAVGKTLCEKIGHSYQDIRTSTNLCLLNEAVDFHPDIMIISNVLNEGEGHTEASMIFESILEPVTGLKDIIVIETASEGSSRQMCNIGRNIPGLHHIGPCPSNGNDCHEWTFREFRKRIYEFERRCCGTVVGAARDCKYSLSLLSFETDARYIGEDEGVVIRHLNPSGRSLKCRYGDKIWIKSNNSEPWDIVVAGGGVKETFP